MDPGMTTDEAVALFSRAFKPRQRPWLHGRLFTVAHRMKQKRKLGDAFDLYGDDEKPRKRMRQGITP
jgi:hypothetical protein